MFRRLFGQKSASGEKQFETLPKPPEAPSGSVHSPAAETLYRCVPSEVTGIISRQVAGPLAPYEQLEEWPAVPGLLLSRKVQRLLADGWSRDGVKNVPIKPPLPWDGHNRSFAFHMHAWEPLGLLLADITSSANAGLIKICREFSNDWLLGFQMPAMSDSGLNADVDAALARTGTMAWYDMAVGQRIQRMSYLADVLFRQPATDDALAAVLLKALVFHHELLAREHFFVSHNNHGFYQALGQLASARRFATLPGFGSYAALAEKRLGQMLEASFFASGPHKEHSPAYHSMVLGSALGARRAGLITDPNISSILANAEEAFGWMIQPDHSLVPFGDTSPKSRICHVDQVAHLKNAGLRYLLTDGEADGAAPVGMKAYTDAGYVFARKPVTTKSSKSYSYFAQCSAFHSRVHKHADHMNFVWHDSGCPIFTDPGRYGYVGKTVLGDELSNQGFYYSDPKRMYVEKTRAHNCVEIDGRDYQRKGAKPFGSALKFAQTIDDNWVTLSEVRHSGPIRHFRLIICRPGHFLLAADWLKDGQNVPHDFSQWFQLAPGWKAFLGEDAAVSARNDSHGVAMQALRLADGRPAPPISGQSEPDLQGWISDDHLSMVPATSLHWQTNSTPLAKIGTLFVLSSSAKIEKSSISDGFTKLSAQWRDDHGSHDLTATRDVSTDKVDLSLKTRATA